MKLELFLSYLKMMWKLAKMMLVDICACVAPSRMQSYGLSSLACPNIDFVLLHHPEDGWNTFCKHIVSKTAWRIHISLIQRYFEYSNHETLHNKYLHHSWCKQWRWTHTYTMNLAMQLFCHSGDCYCQKKQTIIAPLIHQQGTIVGILCSSKISLQYSHGRVFSALHF